MLSYKLGDSGLGISLLKVSFIKEKKTLFTTPLDLKEGILFCRCPNFTSGWRGTGRFLAKTAVEVGHLFYTQVP